MKNLTKSFLLLIILFSINQLSSAQVSGTVFRDFNGNGVKNNSAIFNEPFVSGVTVRAFNAANVQLGATKITDAAGAYSFTVAEIPNGTAVRIEFTGLTTGYHSSVSGTDNGTNIQFLIAPSSIINFAINSPSEFSQTNPTIATNSYVEGDAASSPLKQVLASVPYTASGTTGVHSMEADHLQLGATWGLAYHRKTRTLFASAFQKRHTSYGSGNSTGVIYKVPNPADGNTTGVSVFLDLNALYGTNVSGNNPHPNATANFTTDEASYGLTGKISIGGIDLSEDENFLWVVNLNDRQLYKVPVGPNLEAPTSTSQITRYPLYNQCDCDGVGGLDGIADQNLRPFAVKAYGGKIYIGMVCAAYSTPNDFTKLTAYVYSFDPVTTTFTQVLTFPLTYNRGTGNSAVGWNVTPIPGGYGGTNTANWRPWDDTYSRSELSWYDGSFREGGYPQPMLSDIEFDALGNMHIGLRDRFGDMVGDGVNEPGGSPTLLESDGVGDILRATPSGSTWSINITQATNTTEFYLNDNFGTGHLETSNGGLAHYLGTTTMVNTVMDPVSNISFGLDFHNSSTGALPQTYQIYRRGSGTAPADDYFAKSNGNGDVELLSDYQPIQIGNRIWLDTNGNGIQDAGETTAGVPNGTTVTLRSPGVNGIYGDGDDQTWTTTTDAAGNYYFSTLSSTDNRKPATWIGVGNVILPGYDYRIEVATPANNQVTQSDAVGNGVDNIDNDAVANGVNAYVTFNSSNTNHNFDIGFKALASLGDRVWRDDDKDGIQDAGEPGVTGVTVTLYDNAGVVVSTTVTDAYGNYLFDNLSAGTYQVGFTAPTNYSFTTQTNNTDNTVLTGGSTAANGSDVNAVTGRTANVVLTSGENERNIDAGLIFTQPATASIGDRVWFDANGNGIQDANEAGVAGVTVTLYNNAGVAIATTVTDANGNYLFSGLSAATYSVGFTLPSGMNFTSKDLGGNDNTDSDVNTSGVNFGKTDNFVLAAGEIKTNTDAGLVMAPATTASIGDRMWNDINSNGLQDAGEPGIAGVTVNLYRDANGDGVLLGAEATTPYATTVTDAFGNYIFNNLPTAAGSTLYQVGFVVPGGYTFTLANTGGDETKDSDANIVTGRTGNYFLFPGQRNLTVDAGLVQTSPAGTARLGDTVWFDANGNGVLDALETGVAGVTVTLYNNLGVAIATTASNANGNYQFINLAAGDYSVGFTNLPAGYSLTPIWNSNDANATNSDANPATGRTGTITLSAGESEQDVDAGLVAGIASGLGSIGNKVFYDLNGNGLQDAGELGVSGILITLLDAGVDGIVGNADDGVSRTTTTNALGEYIFTGLLAGNYAVQFGTAAQQLPAGYTVPTANQGTNDAIDSDGLPIATNGAPSGSSRTGVYNLSIGEDNLTIDLGLVPASGTNTLGNYVWFDSGTGGGTANDGIQNGAEQGVAGVTVKLYRDANNDGVLAGAELTPVAITTTDANGGYLFTGLADGSYQIEFNNLPAGFNFTGQNTDAGGVNGATNSDPNQISGTTVFINLDQPGTNPASVTNLNVDGGITSTRAALGNYVWIDTDGNGTQIFDGTEPGVAGVTVTLYRLGFGLDGIAGNADDALPVASMITDQDGRYLFSNLLPGTYEVEFNTIPGGLSFTQRNTPGDNGNNTNSDAVPVAGNLTTGRTTGIVLSAGETDLTIDAGLFKPRAVIGNFVWSDTNSNGVQDAGEPGLSGVVVTLIDGGGNAVAIAVTDANGNYLFPNVAPGTYSLSFTNLPNGVTFTTPNQTGSGGNDNNDSDVIGTTITGIVVTTSTSNLSFDAGVVGAIILPAHIELIALKQNSTAKITWKVTQEENVATYVLEHSLNGVAYTAINSQLRNGSSEYQYLDMIPATGINYYRIKIIDKSGRITYSEVKVLMFGKAGIVLLFPNPATDKINIQLPENWQGKKVTIELYNQMGQLVVNKTQPQANQIEGLNVSNLARGIYTIRLQNENGIIEVRKVTIGN